MTDIFSVGSMKQLPFTISSKVFVHLLFSYHVTLVKMMILYSLYFLNVHSTSGSLVLAQDSLVSEDLRESSTACTVGAAIGIGSQFSGRAIPKDRNVFKRNL